MIGTRGSGQQVSKLSRIESGRIWRCSKSHGSSRVESGGFQLQGSGRVGSGPRHPHSTRPARSDQSVKTPGFLHTHTHDTHKLTILGMRSSDQVRVSVTKFSWNGAQVETGWKSVAIDMRTRSKDRLCVLRPCLRAFVEVSWTGDTRSPCTEGRCVILSTIDNCVPE